MADEHDEPEDGSDYEIGYGRPPVGSRFSSTNQPANRGRRKGSRGVKTIVREFVTTPRLYTRNGVSTKGEPLEIMIRTLFAAGILNSKLGFQFYELVRSVLGDEDMGGRRTPLSQADRALLADYVSNYLADAEGDAGEDDPNQGDAEDGFEDLGGGDVA